MAGIVDCSDFCRLCLVKEQVNNPIFEDDGRNRQVHTKISTCLPVKVTWEDALPKRICDGCNYKLDQQFQFWSTSVNSEKQLKQWLGIVDEEEPKPAVKTKKEKLETSASKRPRRNARRKAVQNIRQAVAAQQQSDSDDGEPLASLVDRDSDFDYNDTITKEETNSENDFPSNNTDSVEPTTFVNVTLDNEIGQAGPSGIQKPSVADTGETEAPEGEISWLSIIVKQENHNNDNNSSSIVNKHEQETDDLIIEKLMEAARNDINAHKKVIQKYRKQFFGTKVSSNYTKTETGYKCLICSKEFKKNTMIRNHITIHKSKRFQCSVCPQKFRLKHHLEIHEASHTNTYKFKCKTCNKGYNSNTSLKEHVEVTHEGKRYVCEICKKPFKSKPYYIEHKAAHVDKHISAHQCSLCEKTFVKQSGLRRHVKVNHENQLFMCHICGKGFKSKEGYDVHILIHDGKKPFPCVYCGKCFVSKKNLRTHVRVHTGEKPFACCMCNKSFTQQSTLIVHKRSHTGERPYPCHLCEKAFVTKTLLNTHLKSH